MWVDVNEKYPIRNIDPAKGVSNFKGDVEGIFSNLKNENIIRSIRHQQESMVVWCNELQEDHEDILRFISLELSENEH